MVGGSFEIQSRNRKAPGSASPSPPTSFKPYCQLRSFARAQGYLLCIWDGMCTKADGSTQSTSSSSRDCREGHHGSPLSFIPTSKIIRSSDCRGEGHSLPCLLYGITVANCHGLSSTLTRRPPVSLTARDLMDDCFQTLRPEMSIAEAVRIFQRAGRVAAAKGLWANGDRRIQGVGGNAVDL